MRKSFVLPWVACIDESMLVFNNEYNHKWTILNCKPHPLRNEDHTTACCLSKKDLLD